MSFPPGVPLPLFSQVSAGPGDLGRDGSGLQWQVGNPMAAVAWGLYPKRGDEREEVLPAPMRAVGIGWLWGA